MRSGKIIRVGQKKRPTVKQALSRVKNASELNAELNRLRSLLESKNLNVRGRAVLDLGQLGDKRAAPDLRKFLTDKEPILRGHAAVALGRFKDKAAAPGLKGLLNDQYSWIRTNASWALKQLGYNITIRD